jgi:hypothetical protein
MGVDDPHGFYRQIIAHPTLRDFDENALKHWRFPTGSRELRRMRESHVSMPLDEIRKGGR